MALAETLVDNFDDNSINDTLWEVWQGTGTVEETGQQIVITPTSSGSGDDVLYSFGNFDLTSSYFFVNVKQVLNASNLVETILYVRKDDTNFLRMTVAEDPQVLYAHKVVDSEYIEVDSVAYNSTTMAWWRIRESSGTIYWDYSANGSSWTNFTSTANPFVITAVNAELNTYINGEASPGSAIFDSFNTAPAGGVRRYYSPGIWHTV